MFFNKKKKKPVLTKDDILAQRICAMLGCGKEDGRLDKVGTSRYYAARSRAAEEWLGEKGKYLLTVEGVYVAEHQVAVQLRRSGPYESLDRRHLNEATVFEKALICIPYAEIGKALFWLAGWTWQRAGVNLECPFEVNR